MLNLDMDRELNVIAGYIRAALGWGAEKAACIGLEPDYLTSRRDAVVAVFEAGGDLDLDGGRVIASIGVLVQAGNTTEARAMAMKCSLGVLNQFQSARNPNSDITQIEPSLPVNKGRDTEKRLYYQVTLAVVIQVRAAQ